MLLFKTFNELCFYQLVENCTGPVHFFCIHGNHFPRRFLPPFILSCVSSTLSYSPCYKRYIMLFLDIAFTSWPHLWFQISNSIAYFFLQLVEAKRNKANRTCTTTKHETGTQWSICTSNRRDRRMYHVTSAVLVPSFESASILSFSCNTGLHCSGNTSICIRWSKTQFPLYVTWRVSCALLSSFA